MFEYNFWKPVFRNKKVKFKHCFSKEGLIRQYKGIAEPGNDNSLIRDVLASLPSGECFFKDLKQFNGTTKEQHIPVGIVGGRPFY